MFDKEKIGRAFSDIIDAIGEDSSREELRRTPERVAESYAEIFSGLVEDPIEILSFTHDENHHEMVVLNDIQFYSMCEHHFIPFFGKATIGYVPNGQVAGISRIARALDVLARRPQLQERLTRQLASAIDQATNPAGVGVVIEAEHLCMAMRGVRKLGTQVVTSAFLGSLKSDESTRNEFHALAGFSSNGT